MAEMSVQHGLVVVAPPRRAPCGLPESKFAEKFEHGSRHPVDIEGHVTSG